MAGKSAIKWVLMANVVNFNHFFWEPLLAALEQLYTYRWDWVSGSGSLYF